MEKMRSENVVAYEWLAEYVKVSIGQGHTSRTQQLVRKRVEVDKWNHDIGPNVFKVVEMLKLKSNIYHPEYSGNFHYQVRGPGDD
ncbi:hypothetical protein LWI29_021481 [Acer saccharum]|uniref:Uncharacterized protein n=1 Tax=Acer saccharum TaxID=4024 RepID=A0AA39RSE3_ACESA|nr:hypothetical protein LWI29_021481 [Acer saccharum]